MNNKSVNGTHWSFWLISVLALIWSFMGCINYILQMNPDTVAEYPEAARALVESRPAWATGAFAITVFGGALGAILLLFRKSAAYYVFIASLLGVIFTLIHTFSVEVSTGIVVGSLMSLIVGALLVWYSKYALKKNWIG